MTTLPPLEESTLTLNDGVAVLCFERDDVLNALTGTALAAEITAVCEWVNIHNEVGTLILTGRGSAFSAGGNIFDIHEKKGMFGGSPTEIEDAYRFGIQRMTRAMYDIEVPTIAAINGAAIGAGFDLTCMCDIRIASDTVKMGETFVNLGIVPGDGGAWFLPRVVGLQRAAELTFSGRVFDADEGQVMGIIMEVCPAENLMSRCEELARKFASKPRHALRASKRLLRSGQRMGLPDFLDYCASLQSVCHTSEEHQAAVTSMVENMRSRNK